MVFQCVYCDYKSERYKYIVDHLIYTHRYDELKFKRVDGQQSKIISYKITPEICREQGRTITVDETNITLHVSRRDVIPKESPLKKICKLVGPMNDIDEPDLFIGVNSEADADSDLKELTELLPDVIKALKEHGKYEDYKTFNELIKQGKFPLDNIAFLLFLDVVRWFALDKSTTFMRYSDECKLFWRTGYKLFRGRFLRFMGGPKNKGFVSEGECDRGHYCADNSSVNFVIPDRKVLTEEPKMLPSNKPGIITEMIEDISRSDINQNLTYKVCVDGKKINSCSKGEVDLWGYEGDPTLETKQKRLEEESSVLNSYTREIESHVDKGHIFTQEIVTTEKDKIVDNCKRSITILSHRIKDLRQIKVKKMIAVQKLEEQIKSDWRSSNYALVISSLRTSIYQIENCVEELLNIIEKLCHCAAVTAGNLSVSIPTSDVVDLNSQTNYVCLGEMTDSNELGKTELVKQRSTAWHKIRESSLVTGSAINKAIGLDGLKSQKSYLEIKTGRRNTESVSEELKHRLDYGSRNEINAVATFVSTFIPVFETSAMMFEEGCYVLKEDNIPYLVVSPDGSVRSKIDEKAVAGIEIKCPIPGKLYTTPVQYTLPHYYVPQVLSEMKCLDVDKLYFVSYSKESTAVHTIEFDQQLWTDISVEIKNLDPKQSPKRLSPNLKALKQKIDNFRLSKVELVAEIKSRTAKPCKHGCDKTGRIYHDENGIFNTEVLLSELQRTLIRGCDAIKTSYSLSSHKASEVLVFLLADLDRIHKAEHPNAFPIAYALKGYSMKASVMRNMLEDVFYELFLKGLYTPVVSYDGQWAVLAFKAKDGKPLTLLELQKQVYNEVKTTKKSDLTKLIFETGLVRSNDDLVHQIQYVYRAEQKAVEVSLNGNTKIFKPSLIIQELIVSNQQKITAHAKGDIPSEEADVTDDIISVVPTEILDNLSDEEIEGFQNVRSMSVSNQTHSVNLSNTVFAEALQDVDDSFKHGQAESYEDITEQMDHMEIDVSPTDLHVHQAECQGNTVLNDHDIECMLLTLQSTDKAKTAWKCRNVDDLKTFLFDTEKTKKEFSKYEMTICLEAISETLQKAGIRYKKNWNKSKIADLIHDSVTKESVEQPAPVRNRRKRNPDRLVTMCKKKINSLPKVVLNAAVAEHKMQDRVNQWREESPFAHTTEVGNTSVQWFSAPEYNTSTLSYIFSFLDVHHLLTNCRIKVCKDGLPERNINKQAWIDVAKSNTTKLKLPHVVDLIDKQSDSIARETFSEEVENAMRCKYPKEAYFCRIIREFYEAEDEPGFSAEERCRRRMSLRTWLLDDINVCRFPPYGSHIKSVPNVMFQGFITNIERRMQLFPYVKCGTYNVRSLGSLEAENLFGQFQDLDPKGSGVIRAEEIPSALENACQLLRIRLMPDRPFHMTLSKAKVYPVHDLLTESGMDYDGCNQYLYPLHVSKIVLRDHMFDARLRAKRKARRRLIEIKGPDDAARGVAGVRQYHKCDESKILPHKRLGIDI